MVENEHCSIWCNSLSIRMLEVRWCLRGIVCATVGFKMVAFFSQREIVLLFI